MSHSTENFGNVIIIQKHEHLDQARSIVIPRLLMSSLVVVWLGFWASFAISIMISKRVRKSNQALVYASDYDQLLSIPNNKYLISYLNKIRDVPSEIKSHESSLILLSFENIETLVTLYGIEIRDLFLIEINKRLSLAVGEKALVGTFREGMFYLFFRESNKIEAETTTQELSELFNQAVPFNKMLFTPSIIQSVYVFNLFEESVNSSINCALFSLLNARENNRKLSFYDHSMASEIQKRTQLSQDLSLAIINNEFVLHYQPKIDLSTQKVIGVEALVRWNHPTQGLLYPNDFIDLIETSSISNNFTINVIEIALKQSKSWHLIGHDIPVAINITPFDLKNTSLMDYIENLFSDELKGNDTIQLELTELETDIDLEYMAKVFGKFKELGIHRSVDDYGTGMCSLAYLKEIPIDTIKIDRTFISDLDINRSSKAITESTIRLAKELHCNVVAEGVETKEVSVLIQEMGCEIGQGYFYSKPLTNTDLLRFLQKGLNYS